TPERGTEMTTHTSQMRIVEDTTTPTGAPGILVECTCGTPHGTGRAILVAAARDGLTADPVRIHGFVTLAWHPVLSKAPQIRANGTWRDTYYSKRLGRHVTVPTD